MSLSWGTNLLSRFSTSLCDSHLRRVLYPMGVLQRLFASRHKDKKRLK